MYSSALYLVGILALISTSRSEIVTLIVSGNGNLNWSDPTVWSTGVVPSATSDVVMSGSSSYNITAFSAVRISTLTVSAYGFLSFQSTFTANNVSLEAYSGARFTFNDKANITALTMKWGAVRFASPSTVGSIAFAYSTGFSIPTLEVVDQLNITNKLQLIGTTSFVITHPTNGTGAVINLLQGSSSEISNTLANTKLQYITINNFGDLKFYQNYSSSWSVYSLTLVNKAGGRLLFDLDNSIYFRQNRDSTIQNYGLINCNVPTNRAVNLEIPVSNFGSVFAASGYCALRSNGNHTGHFNSSQNGIVLFGGNNILLNTSSIHGNVLFDYNTQTTIYGAFDVLSFSTGGTVTFMNAISLDSITVTQGGHVQFMSDVALRTAPLNLYFGSVSFFKSASVSNLNITNGNVYVEAGNLCVDQLTMIGGTVNLRLPRANVTTTINIKNSWLLQSVVIYGATQWGFQDAIINMLSGSVGSVINSRVERTVINNFGTTTLTGDINWGADTNWINHPTGNITIAPSSVNQIGAGSDFMCAFTNYGTLKINAPNATFNVQLINYGNFDAGTTILKVNSTYGMIQRDGVMRIFGSVTASTFAMVGGFLDISGTSSTLTHIGGIVRPGGANAIGQVNFFGYFWSTAGPSAAFHLEASGNTTYDKVTAPSNVCGCPFGSPTPKAIIFDTIGSYVPAVGQVFPRVIVPGAFTFPSVVQSRTITVGFKFNTSEFSIVVNSTSPSSTTCNTCANSGFCSENGTTCGCPSGFNSTNCAQFTCNSGCGAGTCVGPNLCECPLGYDGYKCDWKASAPCPTNITNFTPVSVTTGFLTTRSLTTGQSSNGGSTSTEDTTDNGSTTSETENSSTSDGATTSIEESSAITTCVSAFAALMFLL